MKGICGKKAFDRKLKALQLSHEALGEFLSPLSTLSYLQSWFKPTLLGCWEKDTRSRHKLDGEWASLIVSCRAHSRANLIFVKTTLWQRQIVKHKVTWSWSFSKKEEKKRYLFIKCRRFSQSCAQLVVIADHKGCNVLKVCASSRSYNGQIR